MERRHLGDDRYVLVPPRMERDGFVAAFTERTGGRSSPPYDTLNLGLRTDDLPGRVRDNRAAIAAALDVSGFALGEQVHGAGLAPVGEARARAGYAEAGTAVPGVDALTATRRGLPLAVLTADCLPIALASAAEGRLAVVHAGWRGLASGILDRAVTAFDAPETVRAAIGPAIGPCHYEVGEDVALAVAAGSEAGAVTERRGGALYLDLPGTAARALRSAGVRRLEDAGLCTACERNRFFSHRRSGSTGRQALIAWRV